METLSAFSWEAEIADLYPLMILYSNPSESKLNKNSNTQFTPVETGSVFLEKQQIPYIWHPLLYWWSVPGPWLLSSKSIVWPDKPSAEYCCQKPSVLLKLMFDPDTMGVGFGFGLSIDWKWGYENWFLCRHSS